MCSKKQKNKVSSRRTTFQVRHTVWFISLSSLNDYDVKLLNLSIYRIEEQKERKSEIRDFLSHPCEKTLFPLFYLRRFYDNQQNCDLKDCLGTAWFKGHPTTIFCKISVRKSKSVLPRIFYYLRMSKNFQMTVPFMYNFRSLSNKSRTIF